MEIEDEDIKKEPITIDISVVNIRNNDNYIITDKIISTVTEIFKTKELSTEEIYSPNSNL